MRLILYSPPSATFTNAHVLSPYICSRITHLIYNGDMRGAKVQPRTQALHCFYRDQWRLINAKRARVLGQRAAKNCATISSRVLT